MFRLRPLALISSLLALAPAALRAQDQGAPAALPKVDSIAVSGNSRLTAQQVLGSSGLVLGQPTNYRDLFRSIQALFKTGQFDDVAISQVDDSTGKVVLQIRVTERPMLQRWALKGNELLTARTLKEKIKLSDGRPLDRAAVERARASIDSIYKAQGYYAASVKTIETSPAPGQVGIVFDITEGGRVAISQVVVEGNAKFSDKTLVKHMGTKPEGFFWWQKGKYEDDKLQQDIRERLPNWYGSAGYIDFQVISDSIAVDSTRGKAVLHLAVEEGQSYKIGGFQLTGNRRFSTEDLMALYPFGPNGGAGQPFNSTEW